MCGCGRMNRGKRGSERAADALSTAGFPKAAAVLAAATGNPQPQSPVSALPQTATSATNLNPNPLPEAQPEPTPREELVAESDQPSTVPSNPPEAVAVDMPAEPPSEQVEAVQPSDPSQAV
ncbi:hypothetical protein O181_005654 [Austropuccinia psidii MF-1]|uniref:Uncharacterized protein n=1 Tax=Austropuccinia psidii MF-1 TaxID=1389203 RepID=A0A9Q3GG33_9BASI|nr:hypothetical protein [Austropuccinia psidii MF-1]